jgi:hypothetical protein
MEVMQAVSKVAGWLSHLIDPDQVIELRCLGAREEFAQQGPTWSGFFDGGELQDLAAEVLAASGSFEGIYWTLNPVKPERRTRQFPRLQPCNHSNNVKDKDILCRRWFLVDVDPVRPDKQSATDAEKAAALEVATSVREWLRDKQSWPEPIVNDSGNGSHLLYRLAEDLPVTLPTPDDDLIRESLRALAHLFDTATVKVDQVVFNPARICKLPGSVTCKGTATTERPHRRAKMLSTGGGRVPIERIQHLASLAPTPEVHQSRAKSTTSTDDKLARRIQAYLANVEPAISGQGGHNATIEMAAKLVRGFDLTPQEAYPFAAEWNQRCVPPWSEADLMRKLEEADKHPGPRGNLRNAESPKASAGTKDAKAPKPKVFTNFFVDEVRSGDKLLTAKRGRRYAEIKTELDQLSSGWPKRLVSGMLFVPSRDNFRFLDDSTDLFAWLSKSLPGGYEWMQGPDCIPKAEFYAGLQQDAEEYEAVEPAPHWPAIESTYYIHPTLGETDSGRLSEFLQFFRPSTEIDYCLLKALILTFFWGGPAGERPMFVIEPDRQSQESATEGRQTGKSTVPQIFASILPGKGYVGFGQNDQEDRIQTRLLSKEGRRARVMLIDNITSQSFGNQFLSRMITDQQFSGRELYTGEGSRPNYITVVATFNNSSMNKDLAVRSVVIRLKSATLSVQWKSRVQAFIRKHRWEIISDAINLLKGQRHSPTEGALTPGPGANLRFQAWGAEVLGTMDNYAELADEVVHRQQQSDTSGDIREEIVAVFEEAAKKKYGSHVDISKLHVFVPSQVVASEIVQKVRGSSKRYEDEGVIAAVRWFWRVWGMSDKRFQQTNTNRKRGALWKGPGCLEGQKPGDWEEGLTGGIEL